MQLISNVGALDSDLILLGSPDVPVYLLKLSEQQWALIDGGISKDFSLVWQQITHWVESPSDVKYWLITHKHYDHCGLLSYICPKLPHVSVLVSDKTLKSWQKEKGRKVISNLNLAIGFCNEGLECVELHNLNIETFFAGDELILGQCHNIVVYEAPGHANDHVVFYDAQRQRLFVGDALGEINTQTLQWHPLIFDDANAYLSTLKALTVLPLKQVLLGHGGMLCGENVEDVVQMVYQETNSFIASVQPHLVSADKTEQFALDLNQKWSYQSNRFVPNELHLNSMRFMLTAIKNIQ